MAVIKDIYLGSRPVQKAFKGGRLFYEKILPTGYTMLEYLQSDGSSWIDTGVKANQDTGLKVKFTREPNPNVNNCSVYGTEVPRFSLLTITSKKVIYRIDYNQTIKNILEDANDERLSYGKPMEHFQDKNKVYLNGELMHVFDYETFNAKTIFLWADNGYNNVTTQWHARSCSKIYWCKVYDNDRLVRDFIPCLDAQKVPCLFDKVTKKAFYNDGFGKFSYA